MDSSLRRIAALLLILLVGFAPAAGALRTLPEGAGEVPSEGTPGHAAPLQGQLLLGTAVESPLDPRLEPHRAASHATAEADRREPPGAPSLAPSCDPGIRRAASPPIFLIHCSFLC